MSSIRILQYPDPLLKRKAVPVEDVKSPRIQSIVADMFETLYASENCAALAATQLDIPDAPDITVIDISEKKDQPMCLINATILHKEGTTKTPEGCMSVPFIYEKAERAEKIQVKALDQDGNVLDFHADGFLAKCIQHELDHLQGTLFIDQLSKLKRNRVEKRIEKGMRYQRISETKEQK